MGRFSVVIFNYITCVNIGVRFGESSNITFETETWEELVLRDSVARVGLIETSDVFQPEEISWCLQPRASLFGVSYCSQSSLGAAKSVRG